VDETAAWGVAGSSRSLAIALNPTRLVAVRAGGTNDRDRRAAAHGYIDAVRHLGTLPGGEWSRLPRRLIITVNRVEVRSKAMRGRALD
jgi:hypothetical protein